MEMQRAATCIHREPSRTTKPSPSGLKGLILKRPGGLVWTPSFVTPSFVTPSFVTPSHFFTSRVESPQAWRVSIEQIQANGYNLDIKNPHDSSEAHADPDELLADYQILMVELQKTRDRLKDELFQALNSSREVAKPRR